MMTTVSVDCASHRVRFAARFSKMEFEPVDLLAIVLTLAALIGCINYLWVGLPPAIVMLLGALTLSLLIVSSDHVFHLHVMSWFRGTLNDAHLSRVFLNAILALLLFAG